MININFATVRPLLTLALVFISFMFQQHALAQDNKNKPVSHERMYQIEMIIFARHETNLQEAWPTNLKLIYPDDIEFLTTDTNNPNGFTILPNNEQKLNSQSAIIAKSGSYTLLFHQTWQQMIYAKNTNIFISGGKVFNGHQELEGSISLSVGQFLKLQTNLWLTQFSPLALTQTNNEISMPVTAPLWPALPARPTADINTDTTINTNNSAEEKTEEFAIKRIVHINHQRSMRSIEVHYIDHPLLGIIIKIVPTRSGN